MSESDLINTVMRTYVAWAFPPEAAGTLGQRKPKYEPEPRKLWAGRNYNLLKADVSSRPAHTNEKCELSSLLVLAPINAVAHALVPVSTEGACFYALAGCPALASMVA